MELNEYLRKYNRFKNHYIRLMQRLYFLAVLALLVFSCKPKEQENLAETVSTFEINQKEWPKKLAMHSKTKPDLAKWKEFATLETSFDALYSVENIEDLSLVLDDLVEKQQKLSDSKYPEKLDIPQIKSRLSMFKTFLLKTKGDLHYRLDVQKSTLEMVNAYNAFRNQFNIIANNTLDTELLLEE